MQEYFCECEHCTRIREQQEKHGEWLREGLTQCNNLIKINESTTQDLIHGTTC